MGRVVVVAQAKRVTQRQVVPVVLASDGLDTRQLGQRRVAFCFVYLGDRYPFLTDSTRQLQIGLQLATLGQRRRP